VLLQLMARSAGDSRVRGTAGVPMPAPAPGRRPA